MAPPRGAGGEITQKEKDERRQRKVNRLNSLQMSPVSNLPVTLLMLWMCGNDIGIFSIMMTGNAIYSPISQLLNAGAQFVPFANDDDIKEDVLRAKLIYMALCFVSVLVGLAKLHFMGLLPTAAADWLDHTPPMYTAVAQPGVIV